VETALLNWRLLSAWRVARGERRWFADRLRDDREALARKVDGLLGDVGPVAIPEKIQKSSGAPASTGLLIQHVEASSPADSVGVLLGDILVNLDGQSFEGIEDLHDVLQRRGIGQKVPAVLIRGGQKVELTVTIGERPLG